MNEAHERIRAQAASLLEAASALPPGWEVRGCESQDERSVRLEVGPREGGRHLVIQWSEVDGEPFKGFKVGPVYGAAYLAMGDAWDAGDPGTPEEIRQAAFKICGRLASAERSVILTNTTPEETTKEELLPFSPESVEHLLSPHLELDVPLVDGWRMEDVLVPHDGEVHLVFAHDDVPVRVRLVLTPGHPDANRGLEVRAFPRMGIHRPWSLEAHESALVNGVKGILAGAPEGLAISGGEAA